MSEQIIGIGGGNAQVVIDCIRSAGDVVMKDITGCGVYVGIPADKK